MCDCKNKNWKPNRHNRSIVYRPYYYTYYDYPYFESKYISTYDKSYKPNSRVTNKIRLADGTMIEGFGYNRNFLWIMILLVIGIFLLTRK